MDTLSFGYKRPSNGDRGQSLFTALADNITQLNNHTHNGVNSAKLTTTSVEGVSQSILSASWSATSGGYFKQTVTLPPNLTWGKFAITFQNPSGDQIYPTVEQVSASSYDVYTIDNTEGMTAIYV